jgi:hypothetical protein
MLWSQTVLQKTFARSRLCCQRWTTGSAATGKFAHRRRAKPRASVRMLSRQARRAHGSGQKIAGSDFGQPKARPEGRRAGCPEQHHVRGAVPIRRTRFSLPRAPAAPDPRAATGKAGRQPCNALRAPRSFLALVARGAGPSRSGGPTCAHSRRRAGSRGKEKYQIWILAGPYLDISSRNSCKNGTTRLVPPPPKLVFALAVSDCTAACSVSAREGEARKIPASHRSVEDTRTALLPWRMQRPAAADERLSQENRKSHDQGPLIPAARRRCLGWLRALACTLRWPCLLRRACGASSPVLSGTDIGITR